MPPPGKTAYGSCGTRRSSTTGAEADYAFLVQCLQNTLATGGVVLGAFADGALKGFASVESAPLGKAGDYRDLTCLHVSG